MLAEDERRGDFYGVSGVVEAMMAKDKAISGGKVSRPDYHFKRLSRSLTNLISSALRGNRKIRA